MGPLSGVAFHQNTSNKPKFRSKGADLFWAPPILQLNCAYVQDPFTIGVNEGTKSFLSDIVSSQNRYWNNLISEQMHDDGTMVDGI